MRDNDTILLENAYENVYNASRCCICGSMCKSEPLEEASSRVDCNGYIIYHGPSYVCIATGVYRPSRNPKTGEMVQVYMLVSETSPEEAIRTGKDAIVCGDCKLRGTYDPETKKMIDRICYVTPDELKNVYDSYKKGNYPFIIKDKSLLSQLIKNPDATDIYVNNGDWDIFKDKHIRFGAYGDPTRIPFPILEKMAQSCLGFTSYTHQWDKSVFQGYKQYCMASVDTAEEYKKAKEMGWKTFRLSPSWYQKASNEEACQFVVDGTQCIDCLKCSGTSSQGKDIYVVAHGTKGKVNNFIEKFGTEADFSEPISQEDLRTIQQIEDKKTKEPKKEKKNEVSDLEIFFKGKQENK